MNRRSTIALLGIVAAVGCENMGLDYAGPEGEARVRQPSDLVAAAMEPADSVERPGLVIDGRLWVPSGVPRTLDESAVRPIGSAGGQTVYARGWDEAPYDEIFTATDQGGWRSYLPVIGGGAPRGSAGGGAAEEGAGH